MKFIVYRYVPLDGKKDVEEYITDGMIEIIDKGILDDKVVENFNETFSLLEKSLGEDGLKHFSDGEFKGRVGLTAQRLWPRNFVQPSIDHHEEEA